MNEKTACDVRAVWVYEQTEERPPERNRDVQEISSVLLDLKKAAGGAEGLLPPGAGILLPGRAGQESVLYAKVFGWRL